MIYARVPADMRPYYRFHVRGTDDQPQKRGTEKSSNTPFDINSGYALWDKTQQQAFRAIPPVDARNCLASVPPQDDVHTSIPVMHARGGDLLDTHQQRRRIARGRPIPIPIQRTRHAKQRAGLRQTRSIAITQLIDQHAPTGRLQSFFASTSCSTASSRLRSATSRFSFAFSLSSWRNRRNSDGPSPPNFFFQP